MSEPIRLSDDGELLEAIDVPASGPGVEIRFTTGREVVYPTPIRSPIKEKHSQRPTEIGGVQIAVWLLVGGCLWALAAVIVLISIGR